MTGPPTFHAWVDCSMSALPRGTHVPVEPGRNHSGSGPARQASEPECPVWRLTGPQHVSNGKPSRSRDLTQLRHSSCRYPLDDKDIAAFVVAGIVGVDEFTGFPARRLLAHFELV